MNYKCEVCEKEFYLEWRYKKHKTVHTEDGKYCHYYNNGKTCPYEEIGCMYLHAEAQLCLFKPCRNSMCQFRHDEEIETIDEEIESTDEEIENTSQANRKQCHLCQTLLNAEDNLVDHIEMYHRDYFDGMMEATAEMSSSR